MAMILCACGCGEPTPIAKYTDQRFGIIKGQPLKFINGHNLMVFAKLQGEAHPNWKGGSYTDKIGYIRVYQPDHPHAWKTGYVFQHRLVMEEYLGRYLEPEENPHHCNEKRDDNRIENLELMLRGKHSTHHAIGNKKCVGRKLSEETKQKMRKAATIREATKRLKQQEMADAAY